MNPYQPGEDNQDPYEVGYKAGAASRDAEVVSLTNQRDYEYVRAENAEQERDQLREQVKIARGYFEAIIDPIAYMRSKLENEQQLNGQMAIQLSENHSYLKGLAKKALAATEPKE